MNKRLDLSKGNPAKRFERAAEKLFAEYEEKKSARVPMQAARKRSKPAVSALRKVRDRLGKEDPFLAELGVLITALLFPQRNQLMRAQLLDSAEGNAVDGALSADEAQRLLTLIDWFDTCTGACDESLGRDQYREAREIMQRVTGRRGEASTGLSLLRTFDALAAVIEGALNVPAAFRGKSGKPNQIERDRLERLALAWAAIFDAPAWQAFDNEVFKNELANRNVTPRKATVAELIAALKNR